MIQLAYFFSDPSVDGLVPLKPAEARALGGFVLTLLFGLRVYTVHWVGDIPAKGKVLQSGGEKKGFQVKSQ